jgi:diadenosine tetraphosphate (Ap4A) HIT family hydrolase
MSYIEHIKKMKVSWVCPFCEEYKQNLAVDQNNTAYVLLARAPYHEDHVLICTKRHVDTIQELTPEELVDLYDLIIKRETTLHRIHKEVVVFLRQGKPFGITWKSLHHFHRHIIPHFTIQFGGSQESSDGRYVMSDIEYAQKTAQIKNLQ